MEKYRCSVCQHIYDPDKGDPKSNIPTGTAFDNLPADWTCPTCSSAKSNFKVSNVKVIRNPYGS
ncbi:rubredoxin [Syntrophus aciditrophicus]|nr:rubredoxin [Syntrophus aciditrophicus]